MLTRYTLRKYAVALRTDPFLKLRRHRHRREDELRAEYCGLSVSGRPDTFALYRTLGNDLPPRHTAGQTESNLRFILEHEPQLEACEKRWIVNRIQDPAREEAVLRLLQEFDQPYEHIPFIAGEYQQISLDYSCLPTPDYLESSACRLLTQDQRIRLTLALNRLKTNYIMNVNGARNLALRLGKEDCKWVLPLDGGCFFTAIAWSELTQAIVQRPWYAYFLVPMCRIEDNRRLLDPCFYAQPIDEPQMVFRCDSSEQFDPAFTYGRRDKLELFWRLGVPGPWQDLRDDPWDPRRNGVSPDDGAFAAAGWICRLASGERESSDTKISTSKRFRQRQSAILGMIEQTDAALSRN